MGKSEILKGVRKKLESRLQSSGDRDALVSDIESYRKGEGTSISPEEILERTRAYNAMLEPLNYAYAIFCKEMGEDYTPLGEPLSFGIRGTQRYESSGNSITDRFISDMGL